jgi:CRISPR-associated protein Cas6
VADDAITSNVWDMAFDLKGRSLPLDNHVALRREIERCLPWFGSERQAGIHRIRASHNTTYNVLLLNKRAKLILRLPETCCEPAHALSGQWLDISNHKIQVGDARVHPLQPFTTLYAHFVVTRDADESVFVNDVSKWLEELKLKCKFMCGKRHVLRTETGEIMGFGLMVHGLSPEQSLLLQEEGLGDNRKLGCGIFVPHKGIAAVGA